MQALPTEEIDVNGTTFQFTKLTASKGTDVMIMISKVLGPAVAKLGNGELSEGAIANAIQAATSALKPEELKRLIAILAESSRVVEGGKKILVRDQYDIFFAGRQKLHLLWIVAGLKYNFSDFLEGASLDGLQDIIQTVKP